MIARRFVVGVALAPPSVVEALRAAIGADVEFIDATRISRHTRGPADLMLVGPGTDRRATARFLAEGYPVVVLADARDERDEYVALEDGASGYVVLNSPVATVRRMVWAALAGEPVFQRRVLGRWLLARGRASRRPAPAQVGLTSRQRQILGLIAEGATTKEIAASLRIKRGTVDKHISNLLKRVGVPNRAAAVGALGWPIALDEVPAVPGAVAPRPVRLEEKEELEEQRTSR